MTTTVPIQRGDRVLDCGHLESRSAHWFELDERSRIVRLNPDGTSSVLAPRFLLCCDACFVEAGGDSERVDVRHDWVWSGDEGSQPRESAAN